MAGDHQKLSDKLTQALAALWYRLDERHRRITRRNLEFAYGGELGPEAREELARATFRHFVRFAWETLELLAAPRSYIKSRVVVLGASRFDAALAQGRGVVAVAAHAGNWEYTVLGFGLKYRPVAVVGRELDHPWGARLARRFRQRGGNWVVGKQRGMKEILHHLQLNRVVGIVIDQNTAADQGVLVDFFGKPARTTPVAAILARRRDIPVLPVFSRRLPDGRHLLAILPPLPMEKTADIEGDIKRHLELQSRAIEAWVRTAPSQYLWLHRRWKNQFPEIYDKR
jgi:KDO2-lipid IV(A) lauroyltransferase